jgi:hypothetical protein
MLSPVGYIAIMVVMVANPHRVGHGRWLHHARTPVENATVRIDVPAAVAFATRRSRIGGSLRFAAQL